jgi:lipopolysaccharide transport system ATP-binding protein
MLCDRAVWLDQGCMRACGDPLDVTSQYMQFLFARDGWHTSAEPTDPVPGAPTRPAANESAPAPEPAAAPPPPPRALTGLAGRTNLIRWGSGELQVDGFAIDSGRPGEPPVFEHGARLHIEIGLRAHQTVDSVDLGVGCAFRNSKGLDVVACTTWDAGIRFPSLKAGDSLRVALELENVLAPGEYALVLAVEEARGEERHYFDFIENAVLVRVSAGRRIFSVALPDVRYEVQAGSARPELESASP